MILTRLGAAARTAIAIGCGALALAACSSGSDDLANAVAGQLPDLTTQGLASFECGDGDAIGGSFQQPEAPYVAECWKGSPDATFLDVANETQDAVLLATGGENITDQVCPEDALGAAGGISCRAVLVTEGDSSVVVRTVVVLADPGTALAGLPEDPTQQQIDEVLRGAAVEVLIGTQSPTGPTAVPAASATA